MDYETLANNFEYTTARFGACAANSESFSLSMRFRLDCADAKQPGRVIYSA